MKIETHNLVKQYGERIVVNHVNITVEQGKIVGLLGPNGAGKTTTFYMIVGIIKPDEGTVTVDNTSITEMPIHQRYQFGIGYLPQEASIFRKLTVWENLIAFLQTRSDINEKQKIEKAESLLEEFHVTHVRNTLGGALSGGERRRVEIARALAANPKFILLDEPFAGVDPISVIDIKKIIKDLRDRGLGVLITDHNVRETLDVCERAYIVSAGKMIATGTPTEIMNNKLVKDVYLGADFQL